MKTHAPEQPSLNQMERVREIHTLIKRFTKNPRNESLRVTDESLARKLDVAVRTIQRDRAVLDRLLGEKDRERFPGALESPLQFDKALKSWCYTREVDLSVWVGRLDDEELGALLVAQQSLAVFNGMPLAQKISDIFEEDAGGLIANKRSALREQITNLISFYPDGAGKIDQEHFATVYRGLLLQQQLLVSYQSRDRQAPIERTLNPYHLCCFKHQWRLIAYDSATSEIRDFVVTPRRLKSVKLLKHGFKRPTGFKPHEHLASHEGEKTQTVILRISAKGAPRVLERNWSGLHSVEKATGGGITAHFSVGDIGEFERFLLAFGRDAEVLAPASLRRRLHEEARAMLANSKPR